MRDASTARLLGIKVDELRARRAKPLEPMRGAAYISRSGRTFRAAIEVNPERDGNPVDGTQLLLALCDLHEKPARRRADRRREVVLAELERRGEAAIAEAGEPVPKRACTEWLVYDSIGGERLATELRHLTAAEAEHVRRVSLARYPGNFRQVVWPSQSTAPIGCERPSTGVASDDA